MTSSGHKGRQRALVLGLLAIPLAIAAWVGAGVAQGAGAQPSMEVLPKATGLQYSQTVEIKGHNLPKGSGTVAATICGLQDAAGKTIANPGANDCAGQSEIGKLVIVKSWQSNGEFDTQYKLPTSGQHFGANSRFCDHNHHCALVVADANPSNPAYHVEKVIQFTDQQPFGASPTTTTKPKTTTTKPKTTTTTKSPTTQPKTATTEPTTATTQPESSSTEPATGTTQPASAPPSSANGSISASLTIGLPAPTVPQPSSGNPVPAPVAQGLDQACTQLANVVKQAGGDPTALLVACSSIESGNGPQQLVQVLQAPSLLCVLGASAWQNNQQITDACMQAATALTPVTSQLASGLGSLLPLS